MLMEDIPVQHTIIWYICILKRSLYHSFQPLSIKIWIKAFENVVNKISGSPKNLDLHDKIENKIVIIRLNSINSIVS